MKKNTVIIIHLIAVLLFAAGLSVLYIGSPNGYGISWIAEERFDETPQFAQMVDEDLKNIKRYALLRDAFEENGEVAYDNTVVSADTSNGMTAYTLQEIMNTAQKFGCTMDAETHTISISSAGVQEGGNYELKIRQKAYDPYYYENLPMGPGQGIMSLKDLSYEVMQTLAEYYRLKEVYAENEDSNLYYSMHYLDAEGSYDDLYNTEKTVEEIMNLPRYIAATGRGKNVRTNITPTPENAFMENGFDLYFHEDEYYFAAGVDTTYPYNDRYKKAAESFEGNIALAYGGIVLLAAGALSMLISLVFLMRPNVSGEALSENAYPVDKLPYELFLLLSIGAVLLVQFGASQSVTKIVHILAPEQQWNYWNSLISGIIYYGAVVYVIYCTVRRYHTGRLSGNSLLGDIISAIGDFLDHGTVAGALFGSYTVFVLTNLLGAAALCMTFFARNTNEHGILAFTVILVALITADSFVFSRLFRQAKQRRALSDALKRISEGETAYEVHEADFAGRELQMAKSINHISVGLRAALNEQVKSERLKADLITNVSHDIKTPLTSIINYVDLIKREDIQNARVREYIDILDKKSARLKNLTEDLLEASKASSGNVKMEMQKIDLVELSMQAGAEFEDKFAARGLELCLTTPEEPVYILADGRHLWRVLENLYNNAAKYAMEHTRVYADVTVTEEHHIFTIKNVSQAKLNISPDELTERFVRGDVSRTTEGSGLGLSIARSLAKLMGAELVLEIDGDLYKANVVFPRYTGEEVPVEETGSLIELIG